MNPAHSTALPSADFWSGKRVLLTGHTGFKGAWLAQWLVSMGANVTAIALKPNTEPNVFTLAKVSDHLAHHELDICDAPKLAAIVQQAQPEIVLHLAAQALVRESYSDPLRTFSVNVMGTANVLDALRHCDSVRSIIVVTTDKVYANQEWPWPYRETDRLWSRPLQRQQSGHRNCSSQLPFFVFCSQGRDCRYSACWQCDRWR